MTTAPTRRLTLALMGLTLIAGLAACGDKAKDTPATGPKPAEPKAAEAKPAHDAEAKPAPATPKDAAVRAKVGPPLTQLKKGLQAALQTSLREGGPVAALSVCRDQAPAIAKAASKGGVTVGRVSDKPRAPGNAAKAWMKPLLAKYAGTGRGDAGPSQLVELADGGYGYVEPIFVKGVCTTCHGATIAPELEAKLAELYPNDKARGYQPGDFRGLFWAEVTADAL
ncbi:MAG: hypothetical protein CSA66_04290 [Proteobacteria bacterium]|nr:MAG: hypothetical protein CSA66_04290 [Pseudomonadota bacterium]